MTPLLTATLLRSPFGGGEFIGIIFIALLIGLIPTILYLLTLQRAMDEVHPDHRTMSPGQVWLALIPIFSIVWNFIMIGHIADSLANEYRRRNRPVDADRPGYSVGLWVCILPLMGIIPVIGALASLGYLVVWIIYWSKIAGYKNDLQSSGHWSTIPDYNYQNQYNNNPYVQQQYQQQYGSQQYNQQYQQPNPNQYQQPDPNQQYQQPYNPNTQQPPQNNQWQPPQNPYQQNQQPPQNNQWQNPQNPVVPPANTGQNPPVVPPANQNWQNPTDPNQNPQVPPADDNNRWAPPPPPTN